jgi:RecB family exonuclease
MHRRVNAALGRPASPLELEPADYERVLQEALQEAFPSEEEEGTVPICAKHPSGRSGKWGLSPFLPPVTAALREVDRRLLLQWLADYRQQHEEYDALWQGCDAPLRPEFFEVSFGRGDEQPPSTPEPLELSTEKQTIRLSGRIDRLDTGRAAGHAAFNVLDYKTGGKIALSVESVAAGLTLQLPLYALAAAELLLNDRDAIPWRAGYWYLRDGGFKPKQALTMYDAADGHIAVNEDWEQIRGSLAETVAALVDRLRAGQFPVFCADEDCTGRCPLKTVCRINQIRSLEKTWPPIK